MKKIELKDTRSGFGDGLLEVGKINKNVVALCADLTGSLKMDAFDKKSKTYQGALTNQFLSDINETSILNIYQKVKTNLKNNNFAQIPNLTYSDYDLIHNSL